MEKKYKLDTNETITIDDTKELGSGGEGKVYPILSPAKYKDYCIKVYFTTKRSLKQKKTEYLVKNRPSLVSNVFKVCWPTNILYDGKQFCGYMMPLAFTGSCSLLKIKPSNFHTTKRVPQILKDKYPRDTLEGLINRTKLCINIAVVIHTIHQTGKYVIVDLKPDNILITPDAKVSLVDFDSVQISDNKVFFPAAVCTAEYSPPEYYIGSVDEKKRLDWDYFSYAVIAYELLFGVHPFNATFNGPYGGITDLAGGIKSGLFVHGKHKKYLDSLPPEHPHQMFDALWPTKVKNIFIQTFDTGHNYPQRRVKIDEFAKTLYEEVIVAIQNKSGKKKLHTQLKHHLSIKPTWKDQTEPILRFIWTSSKWLAGHSWKLMKLAYKKANS